jgi:hypothetical protein
MSSQMSWEVASGRVKELRRMETGVDAHPFARFVYLSLGSRRPSRRR